MTRSPLPLRLLPLCVATLLALAPLLSRAGAPDQNDPNSPLGSGVEIPCFDAAQVAPSLSLVSHSDPNDPNSPVVSGFPGLKDCATLCKKVGVSCAKFVKRAVACELRFADDRARFKVRTNCEGLRGAELKTCAAQSEPARTLQRQTASNKLAPALSACAVRAAECTATCNAP